MYGGWLALLADKLRIYIHAWNHYSLGCQSLGLWLLVHALEKTVLRLTSVAVTEIIAPKKYRNKKIKKTLKNVKRCRDGMPKSMQTRQG